MEHPKYAGDRFQSYAAHPYKRQGRGRPGKWRDHTWVSFTDSATLPGRKQQWVQLQATINEEGFCAIVWVDWTAPEKTWQAVKNNIARNMAAFKESLKGLSKDYLLRVWNGGENEPVLKFRCPEVTDDRLERMQELLATEAEAFEIGRAVDEDGALALGNDALDFVYDSSEELMPTYLAMVGRRAQPGAAYHGGRNATALAPPKKQAIFADISWNPYGWTRPYRNRRAPHRYVRRFPGHESLNFDFEKGSIDTPGFVHGFFEYSKYPVELADQSTIFFYSRDYLETGKGYIVGVYGGAKLIERTTVPWKGFEGDELTLDLRAERGVSFRFPVALHSERYIRTRVGQVGFSYADTQTAERILTDEYKECLKVGDARVLSKLTTLYGSVTGKPFPVDSMPPVLTQKSGGGSEVEVQDETSTQDRQKMIDDAKDLLESEGSKVVTARPPVDTSGLFKETSSYTGPLNGRPQVKAEIGTKIGRGFDLQPQPVEGLPGGIVYVDKGYEGKRSDEELRRFSARIKKVMEAIRGDSDGPNPDNIRLMVTHASTDAKLLPEGALLGFNAINDSESDAFWVMAAAREASYLKRVRWYQHLRLMTELVVRAFHSLQV